MEKSDKLWDRNFILLLQGRFASLSGNIICSATLGFRVPEKTGPGTVVGTLMAVSALLGVLVATFAGPLIDKLRKNKNTGICRPRMWSCGNSFNRNRIYMAS